MKKYFIYQGNDHDCGFAALKILLANVYKNRGYLYIEKPGKRNEDFSFHEIIDIAHSYGLILNGFRDKDSHMDENYHFPLIALLDDGGEKYSRHAVVVLSINKDKVRYLDPARGIKKESLSTFNSLFNGEYLEIVSIGQASKVEAKEQHLLATSKSVFLALMPFLSVALIAFGLYFVKADEFIFLPIIFLVLFSLSELLTNWYTLKCIEWFDSEYLSDFFKNCGNKRKDRFVLYHKTKRLQFELPRTSQASLLVLGSILFVLLLNDVYSAFPLIIIMVITLALTLFSKEKESFKEISEAETKTLNDKELEEPEFISEIIILNQKSRKFGFNISMRRTLMMFVNLALAVLLMIMNHFVSVNYVIFHFFLFNYFYENLSALSNYDNTYSDFQKAKARFMDVINLNKKEDDML